MSSYFNFFPSLLYSNTAVTNIIAKVQFDQSVLKNLAVFYPYTVEEGERPDQIAQNYYEDAVYDWVVYFSNGIVDPYHEWPKSEAEQRKFIVSKYGSAANAAIQTAYYTVNYNTDDRVISTAAFNALSDTTKKYWSPIIGYNDVIINYERKELELIVDTNQIVSLTGTFANIEENDVLKQTTTSKGTVSFANSTNIVLKHISGSWQNSAPVQFALTNQNANATVATVTVINQPISQDEASYWVPVSIQEMEDELNERRKHIRLLSSSYLSLIERDMKELLAT